MMLRHLATLTLLLGTASAQTFTAADIRPAPRRSYPFFFAVLLHQDRYVVRDATMVDLIATAYGLDRDNIQGGPAWVDYNRFDILAKAPPGSAKPALGLMLRNLLTERFGLTVHNGVAPMPAYILTAAKLRLKPAEGTGDFACQDIDPHDSTQNAVHCNNATLDTIASQMKQWVGGVLNKPVINSTGIEGAFDFDLKWSRGGASATTPDSISIFDAVERQLGLKLTLETAPRPVVLVDTVAMTPTPNPPGIEKILPLLPPPQFEVATIKPTKPGTRGQGDISGGKVNFTDVPLRLLIDLAWDLNEGEAARGNIVNAPKWLDDDHYDLLAKVPDESGGIAITGDLPMDVYEVELMVRALLVERFHLKAHLEDRPTDAFTLLPGTPKLKTADPSVRTQCKEGPSLDGPNPGGKDPRTANPVLNRLVSCRNMTMPEFAEELQHLAGGYISNSVLDSTGLKGGYDFTLSFSSADRVLPGAQTNSDPNGALSIFDAVKNQLGLKLEKQKRNLPVLVLDHIEQKPTEN